MLTALPHEFLAKVAKDDLQQDLPEPGQFGAGLVFLPTWPDERATANEVGGADRRRAGPAAGGLAAGAGRAGPGRHRPVGARGDAGDRAVVRRAPATSCAGDAFERQLYLIRKRASHLLRGDVRAAAGQAVLRLQPVDQGHHLQGHADAGAAAAVLPGPGRPRLLNAPGHDPLPVLDQHVPQLGPGAAQPLHEPQRRDQHAARQHQLDVRPRRRGRRAGLFGDELREAVPGGRARLFGFRHVRQRAGVPADDRAHAARGDHDDDPGSLAEARDHAVQQAGLLRVPLGADGAVGRPGVDRLHRRPLHRRGAGPQRPAAQPLLHHARRPGDHGQRSRRAAGGPAERQVQGPPAAGQDVPGGFRTGADDPRRGTQERVRQPPAVRRMAAQGPHSAAGPAARERAAGLRPGHAAGTDAGLRLHDRNHAVHAAAAGAAAARSGRLDGQRFRPGLSERQAADAVRLLQAAVRPGDQPADRLDPRRDRDVAGVLHRSGAESAGDHGEALRAAADPAPDSVAIASWPRSKHMDHRGWGTKTIDICFPRQAGRGGLQATLERICAEAEAAIDEGYSLVMLSDRSISAEQVPVSSLAGLRGRASPSGAAGQTHADRHPGGIGRGPRSPSSLPAGRLRCRRDQSLPGL